jgi:hypothetical protein
MILFAVILGKKFKDRDHNPPKTRGFGFGMIFAGFIHIQLIKFNWVFVFEF